MDIITKFFAFLIQGVAFMITGKVMEFQTMFNGLSGFVQTCETMENIFAWANAILPITLMRVLLGLIVAVYVLQITCNFVTWLIDVIVP